jgi:hypothetical protein
MMTIPVEVRRRLRQGAGTRQGDERMSASTAMPDGP